MKVHQTFLDRTPREPLTLTQLRKEIRFQRWSLRRDLARLLWAIGSAAFRAGNRVSP